MFYGVMVPTGDSKTTKTDPSRVLKGRKTPQKTTHTQNRNKN